MTPTEKLIAEARELANAIENCIGGDNCDGCKLKSYMLCEVDRKTADSLIALCDALEQVQATLEQTWEWDMYQCAQREIDRLRKELEAAQNAQRWIPVTERLPEICRTVLISWGESGHKAVQSAAYYPDAGTWSMCGHDVIPTHWMPLPTSGGVKNGT